jgi:hypothetical protein
MKVEKEIMVRKMRNLKMRTLLRHLCGLSLGFTILMTELRRSKKETLKMKWFTISKDLNLRVFR